MLSRAAVHAHFWENNDASAAMVARRRRVAARALADKGSVDGKPVALYTIRNKAGITARITNYGAKVEQLLVPDRKGVFADIVLGFDSRAAALKGLGSMGAFVGRYANRIGGAKFTLDGVEYKLAANNGPNSLHGGDKGSRFQVFNARQLSDNAVEMIYVCSRTAERTIPARCRCGSSIRSPTTTK